MNWRIIGVAVVLALSGCSAEKNTPVAAVEALYAPYLKPGAQPAFEVGSGFTTSLAEEIDKADRYGELLDGPILDFDPIAAGQEIGITDLKVTQDGIPHDGQATVVARFKNMSDPRNVVYEMRQEDGAWKVDNIRSEGEGLRAIIDGAIAPRGDPAAMEAPVKAVYARYAEVAEPEPLHRWAPLSKGFEPLLEMASAMGKRADAEIIPFDPVTGDKPHGAPQVTELTLEPSSFAVIARFKNAGAPQVIVYDLVEEDGAWRIDNIRAPSIWNVRNELMKRAIQ